MRLKRSLLLASTATALSFLCAPATHGDTVKSAFDEAYVNPITPIILQDSDYHTYVNANTGPVPAELAGSGSTLSIGDQFFGVFRAESINRSGLSTPPSTIKTATNAPLSGAANGETILGDGDGSTAGEENSLTAIFGYEVKNILFDGGRMYVILGAIETTNVWDFDGNLATTGDTYIRKGSTGAVIELYEDGPTLAGTAWDTSTYATAVSTTADGMYLASVGFSIPAKTDGGANTAGEYFFAVDFLDAAGGFGLDGRPDAFQLNMNFLDYNSAYAANPFSSTTILPNDITGPTTFPTFGTTHQFGRGATFYGSGTLSEGPGPWLSASDGNMAVMYTPTPAAASLGLCLFGALGIQRRRRLA